MADKSKSSKKKTKNQPFIRETEAQESVNIIYSKLQERPLPISQHPHICITYTSLLAIDYQLFQITERPLNSVSYHMANVMLGDSVV